MNLAAIIFFCLLDRVGHPALSAADAATQSSQATLQYVVDGGLGARFRIEALENHILRIWLKPGGDFKREPSLALEDSASARVPLRVENSSATIAVGTDQLKVSFQHRSMHFEVRTADAAILLGDAFASISATGTWTLTYAVAPDERLMGLGQDNRDGGKLDRRGTIRELWAGQQINSGNVTAQYPIPLLLSTGRGGHAYGLFIDNVHRLRFDLAKTVKDRIRVEADGGEIDLYVIDGPRLADIIERYTAMTGRPSLPPLWALGYWQSKCTYYDWRPLDEAYNQLTARGFPVDVMVIDADWPEIITDYVWAKRWFGPGFTPADKIAEYARKGVKIVLSQSGPMVRQEAPTFSSGWAAGVFASDGHSHPVECGWYGGKLLDFSNPKINDWLWPQTRRLVEQGISGWWLDLTEPEGEPPQTRYFSGGPEDVHNEYSLLATLSFEGVQLAVHPNQRPFILTRCGSAGLQRHHAAVWTGDVYSDYATLRAHPPEMLNSGLSGFTWWTSDTGGFLAGDYRNDRFGAHARLYERWMQFSAFCPITRAHKAGGVPEPYALGTQTEQGTRHYLRQRYRLMPYIYSYAWEASLKGYPLVRPLAFEFPDDPGSVEAPGDEYLFGRDLLVAPVLYEGRTNRKVYFPPGRWVDWDYGYEYDGGREWVVAAPQNRIPVAVREGAIIPTAPDMKNTAEKPWDPLTIEVYPASRSEFTLYRDDGVTFAYRNGQFTATHITSEEKGRKLEFALTESNKLFAPKRYVVHFHLRRAPISLSLDGKRLSRTAGAWRWNAGNRVLSVKFPAGTTIHHVITADLSQRALAKRIPPNLKAEVDDPKAEAAGSAGNPVPHFFPPPTIPARIRAVNYDNGGEGAGFHSVCSASNRHLYRDDAFRIRETRDAGGGYVLSDLCAGEWLRYEVDAGQGGYADLNIRLASREGGGSLRFEVDGRSIAMVKVTNTGGNDDFEDVKVPSVYLNPGQQSILVYADSPGVTLHSFEFQLPKEEVSVYPAAWANRQGVIDVIKKSEGDTYDFINNFGMEGTALTFGVTGYREQTQSLQLKYRSYSKKDIHCLVIIGDMAPSKFILAPTSGEWKSIKLPGKLQPGGNRVTIRGTEKNWDTVQVEQLIVKNQ